MHILHAHIPLGWIWLSICHAGMHAALHLEILCSFDKDFIKYIFNKTACITGNLLTTKHTGGGY